MSKVYLIAKAKSNNNMEKKGMRIFSSLESLVAYIWNDIIPTKYPYWIVIPNVHWMFKAYEFDVDKGTKARLITKDLSKHFTTRGV